MARKHIKPNKDSLIWTREDQGRLMARLNIAIETVIPTHPELLKHHAGIKSTNAYLRTDDEAASEIARQAFDLSSPYHALCVKAQAFYEQQNFYGFVGAWEANCGHRTNAYWLKRALLPSRLRDLTQPRDTLDALKAKPKAQRLDGVSILRTQAHRIQPTRPKQ